MPTISSGDRVLVTGANGYIATWVVRRFLEKGYSVRGTVRSADKARYLQDYFKSYGDKLEIVVVPDISKEGAFDEAVKGVDAIAHVASPVSLSADDPSEVIDPAVKGTTGILKSALNAPGIKRIVITSSVAAIARLIEAATDYTEEDWSDSPQIVEAQGRKANPLAKYMASKTLAERAAWDLYNKHKDQIGWDLSVLNPPLVLGPAIYDVSSPEALSGSLKMWWDNAIADTPKSEEQLSQSFTWIDVRDLADAHILALEKEAAGGERIIVAEGPAVWQEWLDVVNSLQPSPLPNRKFPEGFPKVEKVYKNNMAATKAARIFGNTYISKEESARDILQDFAARGW